MNRSSISLCLVAYLVVISANAAEALESLASSDLVGHYSDELPKASSVGRFSQPLVSNPKISLEYRKESEQEYILLMNLQENNRWKIVDFIKVPKHSKKEYISFACGLVESPPPKEGMGILGVVKQIRRSKIVMALVGWKVNLETNKFDRVLDEKIFCNLHGVD